jgi:hypothetical protein
MNADDRAGIRWVESGTEQINVVIASEGNSRAAASLIKSLLHFFEAPFFAVQLI